VRLDPDETWSHIALGDIATILNTRRRRNYDAALAAIQALVDDEPA